MIVILSLFTVCSSWIVILFLQVILWSKYDHCPKSLMEKLIHRQWFAHGMAGQREKEDGSELRKFGPMPWNCPVHLLSWPLFPLPALFSFLHTDYLLKYLGSRLEDHKWSIMNLSDQSKVCGTWEDFLAPESTLLINIHHLLFSLNLGSCLIYKKYFLLMFFNS